MSKNDMWDLYLMNEDLRKYVDRYAKTNHKDVDDCLMDSVVQAVAKDYIEGGVNYHGEKDSGVREVVPEVQVCDKR